MGSLANRLGKNITAIRERRGLSLNALARAAEIVPSHLHAIERGDSWPGEKSLGAIASALGVNEALLFADAVAQPADVVTLDAKTARELLDKLGIQLERLGQGQDNHKPSDDK